MNTTSIAIICLSLGVIVLIIMMSFLVVDKQVQEKHIRLFQQERQSIITMYACAQDLRKGALHVIGIMKQCVEKDMELLTVSKRTMRTAANMLDKSTDQECVEMSSCMRSMISTIDQELEDRRETNTTLQEYVDSGIASYERSMKHMREIYPDIMKEYDDDSAKQSVQNNSESEVISK